MHLSHPLILNFAMTFEEVDLALPLLLSYLFINLEISSMNFLPAFPDYSK